MSRIRERLREVIQDVAEEELNTALGVDPYARSSDRRGYRNGTQERSVVTEHGPTELCLPRARLFTNAGETQEWRSSVVPRYQRRTHKVDEAILGTYLAGANSRRIRKALQPLLGERWLSKSSISRVVSRLKERFAEWRQRNLADESYVYLFLDAMFLPVRMARRVVKVPVQAAVAVDEDGQKVLLSLEIAGSESTASWKAIVEGLRDRGLRSPALVILDGNPGLCRAVRDTWPTTKLQRCTRHKLENLLAKAPKHSHAELKRDYRAITHAESAAMAKSAYKAFVLKWSKLSSEVVKSLEEAGSELLTFTQFPRRQWKSLRTTNTIERVNEEFRRRTKTQGAFCNEGAALVVLFGLFAMGQIQLRRIYGYRDMPEVVQAHLQAAA
jgi:transposase-like protein